MPSEDGGVKQDTTYADLLGVSTVDGDAVYASKGRGGARAGRRHGRNRAGQRRGFAAGVLATVLYPPPPGALQAGVYVLFST